MLAFTATLLSPIRMGNAPSQKHPAVGHENDNATRDGLKAPQVTQWQLVFALIHPPFSSGKRELPTSREKG